MTVRSRLQHVALALPFVLFLVVYLPAVGHGFIRDDFRWILESRIETPSQLASVFLSDNGFYRPVVALTFAADHALFGNSPLGYGLTNLALALLCAALLGLVTRQLGLPWGAAVLAGALWLLNFHGINWAVLWISGRTALLLTAFALASAWSVSRGNLFWAALFLAAALLSKEEAVALPAVLAVWIWLLNREADRRRRLGAWLLISCACLSGYALLRSQTHAFLPGSAPSYYQFTLAPRVVATNMLEYADRVFSLQAVVTIAAAVVLRGLRDAARVNDRIVWCGAAWIAGGLAITLFLPVRSSLYVCLPVAGSCIIAARLCGRMWSAASPHRQTAAMVVSIALVAGVIAPIHYLRARRHVAGAQFSTRVLPQLTAATADLAANSEVVLHDDPSARPNLSSTFGSLIDDAVLFESGRRLHVRIETVDRDGNVPETAPRRRVARTLVLQNGKLTRAAW